MIFPPTCLWYTFYIAWSSTARFPRLDCWLAALCLVTFTPTEHFLNFTVAKIVHRRFLNFTKNVDPRIWRLRNSKRLGRDFSTDRVSSSSSFYLHLISLKTAWAPTTTQMELIKGKKRRAGEEGLKESINEMISAQFKRNSYRQGRGECATSEYLVNETWMKK